jgi:hypothetical protein
MASKLNSDWTKILGAAIGAAIVGSGTGYWGGASAGDDHIEKVAKEAAASAPAVVEIKSDLKHLTDKVEDNCTKLDKQGEEIQDIKLNVHLLVRASGHEPVNGD